jgi:RNA polymerase sigma-70 factor, ECF subfamily
MVIGGVSPERDALRAIRCSSYGRGPPGRFTAGDIRRRSTRMGGDRKMSRPETELVRRAACGDGEAVARVFTEIQPVVLRYCLARLGQTHGAYGTAEDVAQDVCLTVLRVLPRFRDQGRPFAAFVYGIAARKVSEARRWASRHPQVSLESLSARADPSGGPEELVVAAELSERLHRMLERLPPAQREVIILRVAVGLSSDEVAAILGISGAGVRVAQHRALRKLRTLAREVPDEAQSTNPSAVPSPSKAGERRRSKTGVPKGSLSPR